MLPFFWRHKGMDVHRRKQSQRKPFGCFGYLLSLPLQSFGSQKKKFLDVLGQFIKRRHRQYSSLLLILAAQKITFWPRFAISSLPPELYLKLLSPDYFLNLVHQTDKIHEECLTIPLTCLYFTLQQRQISTSNTHMLHFFTTDLLFSKRARSDTSIRLLIQSSKIHQAKASTDSICSLGSFLPLTLLSSVSYSSHKTNYYTTEIHLFGIFITITKILTKTHDPTFPGTLRGYSGQKFTNNTKFQASHTRIVIYITNPCHPSFVPPQCGKKSQILEAMGNMPERTSITAKNCHQTELPQAFELLPLEG